MLDEVEGLFKAAGRVLAPPGRLDPGTFSGWVRRCTEDPSELGEFRAGVAPTHFLFEAYRQA